MLERNREGLINYVAFVDMGRKKPAAIDPFEQTSQSFYGSMSQLDQERANQKTKEVLHRTQYASQIFEKIKRAMKRNSLPSDRVFVAFDKNKDNKITKEEMGDVLKRMKLGVTGGELDMIFAVLDKNGDGHVNVDELGKWIK